MSEDNLEPLLDVEGAARYLNVSADTVYKYSRLGVLPSVRVGDALRFDRWSLLNWARAQQKEQEGKR